MVDFKDYFKSALTQGTTEDMIINELTEALNQAIIETQNTANVEENISTGEQQTNAINSFLMEYCPNVNFIFEEEDLKILGETINAIIPAFEQMIALIFSRNLKEIEGNNYEVGQLL